MGSTLPRLGPPGVWICVILATCAFIALGDGPARGQGGGPTCFGRQATLAYPDTQFVLGTQRADVIVTDAQVQLIDAREGDDLICAGGGRDVIGGGPGNDSIAGEGGKDNLAGGPDNDRLYGNRGVDLLNGQRGRDRCAGGPSFDIASPRTCERVRSAVTRL
jgi:RTX calcium-binding nonapeptide repeat (4 copies)